ncbi:MAG: hypothetical protein HYW69_01380 [Candidatus Nealsonbacteria bacterium]|nr:hypothetical protein [Candidatus Nealsonbacteria bacterium]
MKKFLPIFILTSLLVLPLLGVGVALGATETKCSEYTVVDTCQKSSCFWNPDTSKCVGALITGASSLLTLIQTVGNWVFVFLMAIAALFLVYAGFLWVTAGGSPENVTKAKTMLINAIIGVAVGLGARGIVAVITSIISG